MTEAIGPGTSEAARALREAHQAGQRGDAATAAADSSRSAGRSGNEGDRVSLSPAAQEALRLRIEEGSVIPLTDLKLITPQGLRHAAETGLNRIMAELGVEEDLEFSIEASEDGFITVTSEDPRAAELEAAINADPELQETLRHLRMTARFAEEGPAMRAAFEQLQQYEDRPAGPDVFAAVRALRARLDGADFTLSLSGGRLTTSFVDAAGQSFGGLAPEAETDLA